MKTLTIKDAIGMRGTEFTFQFASGVTVPAYVKQYDPEVGLSCWSFGLEKSDGEVFLPLNQEEEDEQACCLIICDFIDDKFNEDLEQVAIAILAEIKATGRYEQQAQEDGVFVGCTL